MDPLDVWLALKDSLEDSGRGTVACSDFDCGGSWSWPGSFPNERTARAWTAAHRRLGCHPRLTVITAPARTTAERTGI